MKRFCGFCFAVILLAVFVVNLCACEKKFDFSPYVTQLRADAFFGETENYSVTALPELRESPLIADGETGKTANVLIIKLRVKTKQTGDFTVKFASGGKDYDAIFTFNSVTDCYVSTVKTEKTVDTPPTFTVIHGTDTENVETVSKLNEKTISPFVAIDAAYAYKKEYVDSLMHGDALGAEIYCRLIAEGKGNFWFVGFVTEDKTVAVLVDGSTADIIAEKTLQNDK